MRRECAALALFSLRRKQARPAREPDAIFENQPSALSIQHSVPLVAVRLSLFAPVAVAVDFHLRAGAFRRSTILSYLESIFYEQVIMAQYFTWCRVKYRLHSAYS
jgi:hypothetical protein